MNEDDRVELVAKAIWREDHYDPKLCAHSGDGGTSCAYCEPHDDDTPSDWPADKERAERQARAAITALQGADTVTEAMIERAAIEAHHASCANVPRPRPDYDRACCPWEGVPENGKAAWRAIATAVLRAAAPTGQDDNGVDQAKIEKALASCRGEIMRTVAQSPDVPRHEPHE